MVLGTSFVSILYGKSKILSISFPQWKYYQMFDGSYYIETVDIAKIIKMGHFMLPKTGLLVKKKSFFGWIIKVHDKSYNLELKEFYFCNFTIFELTNQIGHFESLWLMLCKYDMYSLLAQQFLLKSRNLLVY